MLTLSLKVFRCSLVVAWFAISFQTFAYNAPDYLQYEDESDDETVSIGGDNASSYDGDSSATDDEAPDHNEVLVAEQVVINDEEEENPTVNDCFIINGKFETEIKTENNKFQVYYFILKLAKATNETIEVAHDITPYDLRQSTPMQEVTDRFDLEEIIYRIDYGFKLADKEYDSLQLFVKAKSYNPEYDPEVRGVHMRQDHIYQYIIKEKNYPPESFAVIPSFSRSSSSNCR